MTDMPLQTPILSEERPSGRSAPRQPKIETANPGPTSRNAVAVPTLGLPHVVASWPRNSRDTIQIRLDRYQGRDTIDIRSWYPATDTGELKPGKGFTVAVNHLPSLAAGLASALAVARAHGLLQEREGGDE